jgi:hypothetical protein
MISLDCLSFTFLNTLENPLDAYCIYLFELCISQWCGLLN